MSKKLIFLDIDGTILIPDEGIRRTVKTGLEKARKQGHRLFICTGRCHYMLPEGLRDVELDGVIANAGSDIWIGERNIYRTAFDRARLRRAIEVLDAMESIYILEGYETIYVSEKGARILAESAPDAGDNPELARWKRFFSRLENRRDASGWDPDKNPIPKIAFMVFCRADAERVYKALAGEFHVAFYPSRSETFFNGELISRTADKGTAVRRTVEYLRANMRDTVAFGDSMNDYQMIREAACGVVMGGGDERLKAIADRICEPVEEDGVIRELERMGLIT